MSSARCELGCCDEKVIVTLLEVMRSTCMKIPGAMRTYLQFLLSCLFPALPGLQFLLSPVGLYLLELTLVCSPMINRPSKCVAEACMSSLSLPENFFGPTSN